MSTSTMLSTNRLHLLILVALITVLVALAACNSAPASIAPAPTPLVASTVIATVAPITPTATISATTLLTATLALTPTQPLSETVVMPVVEAPESKVDVLGVLTEIERVGIEMGLRLQIDSDNTYTMNIPVQDENGQPILLQHTVRSITVRLLPADGVNAPQDKEALLANAQSYPEDDRARSGEFLTRGFDAFVADGYNPEDIRFFDKARLIDVDTYFTVGVEDVDQFAKLLNGTGAAAMGRMSRIAGSGGFALLGPNGLFIVAGGMWNPATRTDHTKDLSLGDLSRAVDDAVGKINRKTEPAKYELYMAMRSYFAAAELPPEIFIQYIENVNNRVFGGKIGLKAEDYLKDQ